MSLKNLSANKIPRLIKDKLQNQRIYKLYQLFEKKFDLNNDFAVAVSGGPDSLALAFLTKIYSIKKNLKCKYFIVDHKLRKDSTIEAKKVKKILQNLSINSEILTWRGKKPLKITQSNARNKRYELLFAKCKKLKIKNIILGHHIDDMFENFFIRMIRGSGLKGLVSLSEKTKIDKINLIRPLLEFKKKDLILISSYIFNFFVNDPTNNNSNHSRIRIRKLISEFKDNGLDKDKLFLTIRNLKSSNEAISYYVNQNLEKNTYFNEKKNELFLNNNFFNQPYEIVFRSLSESIKLIGKMKDFARGRKISEILKKYQGNNLHKETLGGCIIKKVSQTVILSKEKRF
tara:strand:- start:618 stop:1649 length:1032 start_codon:yes stop_codon:yes gene_type:complete